MDRDDGRRDGGEGWAGLLMEDLCHLGGDDTPIVECYTMLHQDFLHEFYSVFLASSMWIWISRMWDITKQNGMIFTSYRYWRSWGTGPGMMTTSTQIIEQIQTSRSASELGKGSNIGIPGSQNRHRGND